MQRITANSIRIQPAECIALEIVIVSERQPKYVESIVYQIHPKLSCVTQQRCHSLYGSDENDLAPNRLTVLFFSSVPFSFFFAFYRMVNKSVRSESL